MSGKETMLCGHDTTVCNEGGCCMACVKANARRPVEEELERALQLLRKWSDMAAQVTWSPMLDLYRQTRDILDREGK